jgi:hypothetical protein
VKTRLLFNDIVRSIHHKHDSTTALAAAVITMFSDEFAVFRPTAPNTVAEVRDGGSEPTLFKTLKIGPIASRIVSNMVDTNAHYRSAFYRQYLCSVCWTTAFKKKFLKLTCCLDEPTPFVVSDERAFRHLNRAFGSSRIASSAYQKWPTSNVHSNAHVQPSNKGFLHI